jgi:hypothetical protein
MPFIVPGIGYAGLGQQTAAAQQTFRRAMSGARSGTGSRKKRRTPTRAKAARRASGTRKSARSKGRLVRGSAAAKRYMAKIRKMRRR